MRRLAETKDPSSYAKPIFLRCEDAMRSSRSQLQSLSLAVCLSVTCVASAAEDDFTQLFDGKTFAGWEGNLEVFRIEDGAIVGGSLEQEIPQ